MPPQPTRRARRRASGDTLWYKDAIIYELHVRSFQDGNGDGIGDFRGLTSRLPYLHDLGVTAVWLLPFYPSPLRDDGYDIADYTGIHPDYGTADDFRRFLDRAHELGLRVITELVVNHTSDQHAWFERARRAAPGSAERDFYVWSDSPERYAGARIIFQDYERSNWSWDPVAQAYYWHRFYSHQPDLNFDNPAVFAAIVGVLDHWFELGVDGLRLDAVPYLVEREGTHSENLGATHAIVKQLRAHVDRRYGNRVFIAEANQWPEDAAAYFGHGDESHLVFHFPLMPRLFMALRQEDRLPILDILAQTPAPPPSCQWAIFLRNHDELTLEMVTEEERLYMYHVYASDAHARINLGIRRRLAPLLGNHRRRIELMNALLFSLEGTPVLYYGDEIGMGDNIHLGDRNGVRTPMQWSGDRNAGFSTADPQRLYLPLVIDDEYHHQSVHVAEQLRSPHSLLWWMKRLIAIRKRYQAFGRGDLAVVPSTNTRVLTFLRRWRGQQVLVVANLSRFVQHVELDLVGLAGRVPVEAFGRVPLPAVGTAPYPLTLHPHGFLWLELTDPAERRAAAVPSIEVEESWEELFAERGRADLEALLPAYVERRTVWNFAGRAVLAVRIEDMLPVDAPSGRAWLTILRVTLSSGEPERYLLPLGCRPIRRRSRDASRRIAELSVRASGGRQRFELFDAALDAGFGPALVARLARAGAVHGASGAIVAVRFPGRRIPRLASSQPADGQRFHTGSNALMSVSDRLVLKLFRRVEEGPHPELEIRQRLQEVGFRHAPASVAALQWTVSPDAGRPTACVGILQELVPNDGEAWDHAVEAATRFLSRAPRRFAAPPRVRSLVPTALWDAAAAGDDDLLGAFGDVVERLGRRVAALHRALGTPTADPAFALEPFTPFSRRSLYQQMRRLTVTVMNTLTDRTAALAPAVRGAARRVLRSRDDLLAVQQQVLGWPLRSQRIRCHGNLHLGQILLAGGDLVVIDFDGEPGRPVYERRLKRSPLHDVATMVRSLHYAAHVALERRRRGGRSSRDERAWMRAWQSRAGAAFVASYRRHVARSGLLPDTAGESRVLFHAHLVERAVYELGYELNRQAPTAAVPLLDLPLLVNPPSAG